MKKSLLLSVFALAAMSAYALDDITPANYLFNNASEVKIHDQVYGTSNFASPVWETIDGQKYYNEGLAVITGAVAGWGKSSSEPKNILDATDGPAFLEGTTIVDLGGEVGKVLCLSGKNSQINKRMKELFDMDSQIPNMTEGLHWFSLNFFTDPNTLPKDGTNDYYNVRCRITCNFYYNFPNGPEDGVSLVNPYLVGNQNNIQTTDNKICTDWFIKTNEDGEPIDDQGEVTEEAYYWNPDKWLQFEVNTFVQNDEEDKTYSPIRLKYDIKADPLQAGTMFIRSIEFFKVSPEEAVNNSTPVLNFITLKADPKSNGIGTIALDKNQASVQLNGRQASFNAAADVYSVSGTKVAKVGANQGVNLAPGMYIANVNGKSVKFFVK